MYRRFTGRPAWVWGVAALVGIVPFAIVIALLALAALVTTAIVFTILGAIDSVIQGVAGNTGGDGRQEGRRNVTVVRDEG